jgi:threonine dehydrogenase-like Zn-dependent dehydrogenase
VHKADGGICAKSHARLERSAANRGRLFAVRLGVRRTVMRAVVLENTRRIVVREVPDAEMRETTDVLLRITSTAICGTDLINPAGRVAIIGVWRVTDPEGIEPSLRCGQLMVPWSKFFNNNVRIVMGRDDDRRWNRALRDMIVTGRAKQRQVVSHRLRFDDAPKAFDKFDRREDGYIKVVLEP